MAHVARQPLAENEQLAFVGETVRPDTLIPAELAEQLLRARNLAGRDNFDVVRQVASATAGVLSVRWMIDFPPGMSEAEAALYELPSQHLRQSLSDRSATWWRNPHANPSTRALLARRERYLATTCGAAPAFQWVSSEQLPEATLLVVARDDDFTHGVLRSRVFAQWWEQTSASADPTHAVATFPFPWSPERRLSSLTRAEEEARHAVAAAVRTGEQASVDDAVARAYGWPLDLDAPELLARLHELHRTRASAEPPSRPIFL